MRKIINKLLILMLMLPFVSSFVVSANNGVSVLINNTPVTFLGQQPTIIDGTTLVPIRGVFEHLGFNVGRDAATNTAVLTRPNQNVAVTIGQAAFTLNGARHILETPAQIIGGATMLPIRAIATAVGYRIIGTRQPNN